MDSITLHHNNKCNNYGLIHKSLYGYSRRSSQRKDGQHRSSSILRRVSFLRHKDDDEIPLVPIEEPVGEPDTIPENEMTGYQNQIRRFSEELEQRETFLDMGAPLDKVCFNKTEDNYVGT